MYLSPILRLFSNEWEDDKGYTQNGRKVIYIGVSTQTERGGAVKLNFP